MLSGQPATNSWPYFLMTNGRQNGKTAFLLAGLTITVFGQGQPPATAPEIVTDRPDVTESSIVVPKNSRQSENGLTWTSDRGQQTLDLPETLLRLVS